MDEEEKLRTNLQGFSLGTSPTPASTKRVPKQVAKGGGGIFTHNPFTGAVLAPAPATSLPASGLAAASISGLAPPVDASSGAAASAADCYAFTPPPLFPAGAPPPPPPAPALFGDAGGSAFPPAASWLAALASPHPDLPERTGNEVTMLFDAPVCIS